jgi:CBS domain-containing protein
MPILVQDLLTKAAVTVSVEATIDDAFQALMTKDVSLVYVTTPENRLAGVVTDYEVLKHQILNAEGNQAASILMNCSVATVGPSESALAVCRQFRDARLAQMAVVDENGRLVGSLSRHDVMRFLVTQDHGASDDSPAKCADPIEQGRAPAAKAIRSLQPTRQLFGTLSER